MKRGLLGLSLLVLLMQFVSAQFFSGYGGFSLGEFFDRIDPQTIILVLLFFIFFALIFYALSRIFKDPYGQPNKGIAGTIAFAVTSLIIYGLYRTGFNIGDIFYDLGFSVDFLYPILAIVFLIIAALLIWKLRFSGFLMIFGLFILLLTIFTDIFYEKGITFVIGIVLLVFGLLLLRRGRRIIGGVGKGVWRTGRGIGRGVKHVGSKYDWEKEKRQAKAIGKGVAAPFKAARKYRDPGHRLLRYQEKREAAQQRRATKRGLAEQKAAYKEDKRMHPGAIRKAGKGVGEFAQREWQKEKDVMQERKIRLEEGKLRRTEKAAYKEEARRQKKLQRAEKAAHIEDAKRGIAAGKVEEKKLKRQQREEERRRKAAEKPQKVFKFRK